MPNDGGQPPLQAPISNFHPVPTRPVFTPWTVDEPQPEEITGTLARLQAMKRPSGEKLPDLLPGEQPAAPPLARRNTLPIAPTADESPAPLPDEERETTPLSARPGATWHAVGPK